MARRIDGIYYVFAMHNFHRILCNILGLHSNGKYCAKLHVSKFISGMDMRVNIPVRSRGWGFRGRRVAHAGMQPENASVALGNDKCIHKTVMTKYGRYYYMMCFPDICLTFVQIISFCRPPICNINRCPCRR